MGQLWHVFQHSTPHDNPLAYAYGTFAIIFTPELRFHYWFTWKNALLSSNSGNFYTRINTVTKFAAYVA